MLEKASGVEGWMSSAELCWLYNHARGMKSAVEIGSYKGRSALAIAEGMGSGGVLTCIDPWSAGVLFQEFLKNTSWLPKGFAEIRYERARSLDAVRVVADADMVFVDGLHDRQDVIEDIKAWYPKAKRLFCGHDYGDWPEMQGWKLWPDVRVVVDELLGDRVRVFDTIWWVEKEFS